jgi:Fe-S-cluster-containing dehydrogenase component/DMSO reductase anchor subunit
MPVATEPDLLRWLLDRGTAVERFARVDHAPSGAYRELIPLAAPRAGEQYAFEVDLDACTGCKACVTACHTMNGLDDGESWRKVGLLHGGDDRAPWQQTVTTACHHCVDPACLAGCPVDAYEKDPITGIVSHLDDQCIGCRYCTLMCPYDVPQWSASRGIVRKCDMCKPRLAAGEAPACVAACPNEAIRITVVAHETVIADNETSRFLPAAPDPAITQPTTIYRSERPLPRNAIPADHFRARAEEAHAPLVAMLVLTQLAVGTSVVGWLTGARGGAGLALGTAMIALAASLLHLGRPQYAFRAVLGLRHSWLSREIVAFGGFAGLAALAALRPTPEVIAAAAIAGLSGVACSAMVYAATRRETWEAGVTAVKFGLTTGLLGAAVHGLAGLFAVLLIAKIAFELALLRHARDRHHGAWKRSALLQLGPLRRWTAARFGLAAAALLASGLTTSSWQIGGSGLTTLLALAGELIERHLYFVAVASPRMPGGLA